MRAPLAKRWRPVNLRPLGITAMKYIYGPVKSRRLGLSLGVSLSSEKICNLDCVYCQWGSIGRTVEKRKPYASCQDILQELAAWFAAHPVKAKELEFVTLSGLGEPTLNTCVQELIQAVKNTTNLKIAVITNSTLMSDPQVRKELLKADLIIPSLDAVEPEVFKRINRPHLNLRINPIIDGLIALRQEFPGQIWLEIMLVAGVNDAPQHIAALKTIIESIKPDRIQLNSPVRSTAEKDVRPLEKARLEEIRKILGDKAEII